MAAQGGQQQQAASSRRRPAASRTRLQRRAMACPHELPPAALSSASPVQCPPASRPCPQVMEVIDKDGGGQVHKRDLM